MTRSVHIMRRTAVIGVCTLSLLALLFMYELRYMWHVDHAEYLILRIGLALGVLGVIGLWVFRPSRLGTGLIAVALLFYPQLIPTLRVPLNVGFFGFALLGVALVLAATEMRRRYWPGHEPRAA